MEPSSGTGPLTLFFILIPRLRVAAALDDIAHAVENGPQPLGIAGITRDGDGKVEVVDPLSSTHRQTGRGLGLGAAVGVVAGLLFPPTIIAGAIAGAVVGGVAGHREKVDPVEARLREMGEQLQNDSGAVVAVVEATDADAFERAVMSIGDTDATIIRNAIPEERSAEIRERLAGRQPG